MVADALFNIYIMEIVFITVNLIDLQYTAVHEASAGCIYES